MESINILHVISMIDPKLGGVGQAVRTMSASLAQEGVQNEVVSVDDPNEPFLADESIRIHALGPPKGPWQYANRLSSWLIEHVGRFDVIILHGLWLYHGYALRKAVQKSRRRSDGKSFPKVFIMPHGMLDPYFQQASGRKSKALRNWLYWQLIERKIVAGADGLLFTCAEEQRLAREPFQPYRPKSEAVVGLGVDEPPAYTPAMQEAFLERCPQLRGVPYLLFLGRIHPKKGVDVLVNAYQNVRQNCLTAEGKSGSARTASLGHDVQEEIPKLVIAGPGLETPYGQAVQQSVRNDQESEPAVFFTDMLSGDAKWGAFYGCQAFVLPSHQENFGIAVAEALACGKPVLISNQVNIWREIEESGGGFVAENSVEGTQQLLERWLNLPADQKRMMENKALKTFQANFAVAPVTRRLLKTVVNTGGAMLP